MRRRAAWSIRLGRRGATPWLPFVLVGLLATACGTPSGGPPSGVDDEPVDQVTLSYELKDHAQLATDESLTQLLSYDPETGEMVFADDAAQISGLQVGDVLVGGISSASPSGFLQRVTAIREVDGRYQLETEFAALEEAFEDLDLVVVRELAFDDLEDLVLEDGFTRATRPGEIGPLASAGGTLGLDVDKVLYRTSGGTVRARGSLDLSLTAFVDLKIKTKFRVPTGVERFEIGIDVRETLDLRIDADFDAAKVDAEVKVAEFTVATIGAGPFWVDVKVALYLGVDGRVSASMTYQARQEMFVRVGGRYRDGRWSNLSDFDLSFDSDFRVNDISSVDVVGYARAEAKLCPYGRCELVGAATATLGLRYQYERNANPLWVLSMYVDAGFYFEAKVKVWKFTLVDERYEREWRVSERVLRRANFVPELSLLRPDEPTLIDVIEDAEDYFAVLIRDADGPPSSNPISVRWVSDVDGLLQEEPAIAYPIRPGWQYAAFRGAGNLRRGNHLITVTAADGDGGSDFVTFPARVLPSSPGPRIYEFVASPNPTPVGGTVVLTWDVQDTDRLALVRGAEELADLTSRASFTTDPIHDPTTLTLRAENATGSNDLDLVVDVLPVEVTLTPPSSTVFVDRPRDVDATVTGALDTDVTWSTTCGRLEAVTATSVTFVAPPSAGTCSLTAASVADPSARATASITVLPSPPVAPVLAAGVRHSLALTTGGHVYAWGWNIDGQVGNGTTANSTTPVRVPGISNARAVAASRHSLALLADGSVRAWGRTLQSGGGFGAQTSPVTVAGLSDVVAIAAGGSHSLAIRDDGTVWAWGLNTTGQLGNGTTANSTTPVRVSGLERVIAVAATANASYALRSDGTVWSWGHNRRGQLGNGTTVSSTTPVRVEGLSDITALSAGPTGRYDGGYALALDRDGGVWAWGHNDGGQLGVSTQQGPESCLEPGEDAIGACARTPFLTRSGGVAIAAGSRHALMIRNDGRVMAWGWSSDGALGTTWDSHPFVEGLTQAVGIAAGSSHSLAVRSDGTVRAWGRNDEGALGDGTTTDSTVPVTTSILGVGSP